MGIFTIHEKLMEAKTELTPFEGQRKNRGDIQLICVCVVWIPTLILFFYTLKKYIHNIHYVDNYFKKIYDLPIVTCKITILKAQKSSRSV